MAVSRLAGRDRAQDGAARRVGERGEDGLFVVGRPRDGGFARGQPVVGGRGPAKGSARRWLEVHAYAATSASASRRRASAGSQSMTLSTHALPMG